MTRSCDPVRIQTWNLLIRSQMLYSVELQDRYYSFNYPVRIQPETFPTRRVGMLYSVELQDLIEIKGCKYREKARKVFCLMWESSLMKYKTKHLSFNKPYTLWSFLAFGSSALNLSCALSLVPCAFSLNPNPPYTFKKIAVISQINQSICTYCNPSHLI